ncbi:DUF615 domain-containing protein [Ectothiorhodospiraceae bacterium 2226]|nr:DUF615 domain-containing protein [Ectothiorhodospiraceae bacterium 2226]
MSDHDEWASGERPPSKSQRKRDSHALQALGEELVELPAAQYLGLTLPEELDEAVRLARAIRQRGGRKRQLQYIGRLMRELDAAPIRAQLEALQGRDQRAVALHHAAERWRERLLAEGDAALAALVEKYPQADPQRLRQLVRSIQAEQQADKPPRAFRELFRALRELVEE